jgi:very-short-patch-repair endonuclease
MLHGPIETQRNAARLRRAMTLPEVLLWRELRKRPGDLKFRRQHPAGKYVLDFYCARLSLAVEVDGSAHDCLEVALMDEKRDTWLRSNDVTVMRIPAKNVLADVISAVESIMAFAEDLQSSSP